MKTTENIKELCIALHKAQGQMGGAVKASKNPFFKSSYSDLASVMQAISIPFYDNGLSFIQAAEFENNMIAITTRIMHTSGQWIESTLLLPPTKQDPQAFGSAISYGKRYGLQAIAGVPSVDDDAQYASASSQEVEAENKAKEDNALAEMIALIDAGDIAFTEIWHELDRDEQNTYWKLINSKQKKVAREMLDSLRTEEAKPGKVDYVLLINSATTSDSLMDIIKTIPEDEQVKLESVLDTKFNSFR